MKKVICLTLSILTFGIISCGSANAQSDDVIKNVNCDEFKENMGSIKNAQVLDVRTPGEWAEGTLKKAIKIDFFAEDFKTQVDKLDKEKPVLVYCKAGGRSAKAAKILKDKGFIAVYNMKGGFMAWQGKGFEIVK